MERFPHFDIDQNRNYHPHVVILGAGASLAATPVGDKFGNKLPTLNNLVQVTGIGDSLEKLNVQLPINDFESVFDDLSKKHSNSPYYDEIKDGIQNYFSQITIPSELTLYDRLVLSLREQDLIATFNWDPLLCMAYQRNRHLKRLPQLGLSSWKCFCRQV